MQKIKYLLTSLLALIALILISYNLKKQDSALQAVTKDNAVPIYTSDEIVLYVYNLQGSLIYQIVAKKIAYFQEEKVTLLTKPSATLFDKKSSAAWLIQADRVKLTQDRILFLYGNVKINSLMLNSQLQKIKTDNAKINLITQDIMSDDEIILYGSNFLSHGMKMRGNLLKKTLKLIEKVKTSYEM